MAGQRTRVKLSKEARGKMRAEEWAAGRQLEGSRSGSYVSGYVPGVIDETIKQVVGHYPTSRETTIKDKEGKHHTGKRV